MKKLIATVSAFAFVLSASVAFAGNTARFLGNSTDDGFFNVTQNSSSFMGINIKQRATVHETIEVRQEPGSNVIAAGQDIEEGDITVEGGNDMHVELITDVNGTNIECDCLGGSGAGDNETLVEGEKGDDPFYNSDQTTNDAQLLDVDSEEKVDTDVKLEQKTGENVSAAGDDNTGSDIVVGPAKLFFARLLEVGKVWLH